MLTVRMMRYAYVMEFLLAAIASQVVWAEAGGAGHLELIPLRRNLGEQVTRNGEIRRRLRGDIRKLRVFQLQ